MSRGATSQASFSIPRMCQVLEVSPSGYYIYLPTAATQRERGPTRCW